MTPPNRTHRPVPIDPVQTDPVQTDPAARARGGRIVVTGASGNLGSSLVPALLRAGWTVTGICRHRPTGTGWERLADVEWRTADLAHDPLDPAWFDGADAVVHLAWAIQPSHRREAMFATNVVGTRRLVDATLAARVPQLVHLSSLGAYSAAPRGTVATEDHPTDGSPLLDYAWQKATVERMLDAVELEHPELTVTRMRPALVLRSAAAHRVHGLFTRPLPRRLVAVLAANAHRAPVPFQVVHADDVADAIVRTVQRRAGGAFHHAPDPVLGHDLALGRPLARVAAAGASLAWRLRLVAAEPGWIRVAATAPVLDTGRAGEVLDWHPRWNGGATLDDLAQGLASDRLPPSAPPAPVPAPS